jgi:hypothetical protein
LLRLRSNSGNSWNSFINGCFNRFAMSSMHGIEAIYSSIRRILVLTPVRQPTHSSCSMTQARPTFNVSLTCPLYSDNLRNMPTLSPCQSSPIVCLKLQCSGISLLDYEEEPLLFNLAPLSLPIQASSIKAAPLGRPVKWVMPSNPVPPFYTWYACMNLRRSFNREVMCDVFRFAACSGVVWPPNGILQPMEKESL